MTKKEPKHVYAEKKIREAIRAFDIDERIPGERVFARELGISYMTIRKAVENLVAEGILYKVAKKGTYVADPMKAREKTGNIGYFLDSSIKDGLSSPYYSMIFDALEKEGATVVFDAGISRLFGEGKCLKQLEYVDVITLSTHTISAETLIIASGRFPEIIFVKPEENSEQWVVDWQQPRCYSEA